jgi:prepilin-type N-terminal cleavage/methylation domain-containing protein
MKVNKGFTIIEVLVVIAIIAILTTLIFPSLNNMKKKNRDAERIADISSIQLGLALYYSQHPTRGYPKDINDNSDFSPKYVTADSLTDPDGKNYTYVPLTNITTPNAKCTYYHLGAVLELPSAQIDTSDIFDSRPVVDSLPLRTFTGGKLYCSDGNTTGIQPPNIEDNIYNYSVHP